MSVRREVSVHRLEGAVQHYDWGSRDVIAALQGRAPSGRPEAELWFGAHAAAPARFDGTGTTLDEAVTDDPEGMLGWEVLDRFGPQLPFLLKILAIDRPLSLQAHPSAEQAAAGFAAEDARGVPLDARERVFRDSWPKPEMLCAITAVDALCGFRPVPETLALLKQFDVAELRWIDESLRRHGPAALVAIVGRLLAAPADDRRPLVSAVVAAARRLADGKGSFVDVAAWTVRLGTSYPDDPGVVVALLLNLLRLRPGEAVYLDAGNLHAYLHGTAVEVLANSDNVLRGGLTSKHVDVAALLDVLDPRPLDAPLVVPAPVAGGVAYPTACDFFALECLRPGAQPLMLDRRGPEILLALECAAELVDDGQLLELRPGQAAFVPASSDRVALRGSGPVFRATVG